MVIDRSRRHDRPAGQPGPLRSFDPLRIADLEYQAWVGYYQRRWFSVLAAFVSLVPGAALLAPCRRVLARHGRPLTGGEAAVLTVALSLSLCAIVSELFILAAAFTMPRCVIALAALTSVAALWPARRATAEAAPPGPGEAFDAAAPPSGFAPSPATAPYAPSAPSGRPAPRSPLSER